jgi:hypothetical protein
MATCSAASRSSPHSAFTVKLRAFGAHYAGFRACPLSAVEQPLKHSQDARRKIGNTFSRTSLAGGLLVFTA